MINICRQDLQKSQTDGLCKEVISFKGQLVTLIVFFFWCFVETISNRKLTKRFFFTELYSS